MIERYPVLAGAEPWSAPGSGERASIGIVVTHGFTGNPWSTRPLGEALAERGFAVELVRLPGHGTHWRDMMRSRYADWRDEVRRARERLRAADKKVVLAGLSLGGSLSLDVATEQPDAVCGVVSINSTVLDREGLLAKLAPVLEKILPVVPAKAAGLVENDIAKGGDEHAYAWVPAAAGSSFLKELPRLRRALSELSVPVLVAYSPQDHSVPPENSKQLLALLPGPKQELRLERSFHVATLDHDFDLLVERITEFADSSARV